MTKISQALEGVTLLGCDTAPLIYFVESHPDYAHMMRDVLQLVDKGDIAAFSSVITLTEVLTKPKQLGQKSIETSYRDLLLNSRNFTLIPVTAAIAEQAAELRSTYNLRTPDALQLATALNVGCQAFLSNDFLLKRVKELPVLILNELNA
jgi:predicted nucleic acid-binding protein